LKILLVNTSAFPSVGGVENSLDFISKELVTLDHEVKILCLGGNDIDSVIRTSHENIEIIRIPCESSILPFEKFKMIFNSVKKYGVKEVLGYAPDLILSRSTIMGEAFVELLPQIKLIQIYSTTAKMDCEGLYINTQGLPFIRRFLLLCLWPFQFYSYKNIEKRLLNKSTSVVFSKNMVKNISSEYGLSKNIKIIPPGVDIDLFNESNSSQYVNSVKDIVGEKEFILLVGRLACAKNFQIVIKSLRYIDKRYNLVIVGSGPELKRLKNLSIKEGVKNRVIFVGSQKKFLPTFYSLAKLFVLPTKVESFGQVYLEALACGTPCVGFGMNDNVFKTASSEIIKDKLNGVICKEFNAEKLSESINYVLELTPEKYEKYKIEAVKTITFKYSWSSFVNDLLKLR
jgi:glycosyltransferase involved in cell wall biosynthesis